MIRCWQIEEDEKLKLALENLRKLAADRQVIEDTEIDQDEITEAQYVAIEPIQATFKEGVLQ